MTEEIPALIISSKKKAENEILFEKGFASVNEIPFNPQKTQSPINPFANV
jgi:hypothetical protein